MQSQTKEANEQCTKLRLQLQSSEQRLESLTANLDDIANRFMEADTALKVAEQLVKVKDAELAERDEEVKNNLLSHQREIQQLVGLERFLIQFS